MIVAGYAHRYEPDWMIDELRENLAWVDGFAAYDDRDSTDTWTPAKERNQKVQNLAWAMGATWLLFTAPDERWGPKAERVIRSVETLGKNFRYAFPLRELWTPTAYRSDGVWAGKYRVRLYRSNSGHRPVRHLVDPAVYHLKMIEPENRNRRVEVFNDHNTWDNKSRRFEYLRDETGLQLTEIPKTEMFTPPYRKYEFVVPGYE